MLCAVRVVCCGIFGHERSIGCKFDSDFNIYIDLRFNLRLCSGIGCNLGFCYSNRSERNTGHGRHVRSGAQYAG